jgi:TolB-like protein/class 3 adenylate cyclase/Tfp pilus assembly protein PilF
MPLALLGDGNFEAMAMAEGQSRRLAAILAADIAGYSALMGVDEARTVRDLKGHQVVVLPMVGQFGGRIIDTAGDGILAEFASVVSAVECALALQKTMAQRNSAVEPAQRMQFRIGVNVGDVIYDEARIYGDGVNIAARLEGIAEPGGICLSEDAYRQVRGKLDTPIADAGEQSLKNISNPIRVYRIEPSVAAAADVISTPAQPGRTEPRRRWSVRVVAGAAMVVAVALAALTGVAVLRDRADASKTAKSSKPIAVSAMPIIAVLPFANQTGEDSQDYFAEGVTEEVINALGRFNTLRVIGRNTVLRYKKRPPTPEEIASELGANYLVVGSVKRAGQRVRIAAQLTEARAGTVMWSDRFEGDLASIFDLQDAIARQIAGTLAANIALVEGRRALDHPKPNPNAFDLALQARALGHASTRPANRRFRELIAQAIELDPNYAAARALLADALYSQAVQGWTEFPDRELSRGADEARKAITLASDEPDGYRALGRILLVRAEYDQAQNALKRAIEINPSDANALALWGAVQSFSGEIASAIDSLQLALKLDPMLEPNYVFDLSVAYYLARRHEDALRIAERGLARYPNFAMFNAPAAAAAAQLRRKQQAAGYVEALRRGLPGFDLETLGSRFKNPAHPAYLRDGLKAAGL